MDYQKKFNLNTRYSSIINWKSYDPGCFSKIKEFKNFKKKFSETKPCELSLDIKNRIGSESNNGVVYKMNYDDNLFAFKILKLDNIKTYDKNLKEIILAENFGESVEKEYIAYFPMFLVGGNCGDFKYPNDEGGLKMKKYALEYEKEIRKLKIYAKNNNIKSIEDLNSTEKKSASKSIKLDEDIEDPNKIPVQFMISELGKGDIINWTTENKNDKNFAPRLFEFFKNSLEGIHYMHLKNVVHNDLHMGNVLIVERGCGEIAVIHDFGESELVDGYGEYIVNSLYLKDVDRFLKEFSYNLILSQNKDKNKLLTLILDISRNIKKINMSLKNKFIDLIPTIFIRFLNNKFF